MAQQTTLQEMQKSPEVRMPAIRAGFFESQGFELMQRIAKALAASSLVPKEYQNNVPNCMIAINMAERIGADPMMVMQNLYIVHNRPGWSAQFLIATFNHCGRYSSIKYEWSGEKGKDTWGCKAWAVERETGERVEGPEITIELAKKEGWYQRSGSKWQTTPQLMLMYRSAAWMIRTNAPEIAMGLQTADEIEDFIDTTRGPDGVFTATTSSELKEKVVSAETVEVVDTETGEVTNQKQPESEQKVQKQSETVPKNEQSVPKQQQKQPEQPTFDME